MDIPKILVILPPKSTVVLTWGPADHACLGIVIPLPQKGILRLHLQIVKETAMGKILGGVTPAQKLNVWSIYLHLDSLRV